MKVAVYLGKATPRIVKGLKSMSDEIDYSVYPSVESFVQEAELRHLYFNRVVFNNRFVSNGESDYVKLNEFISNMSNGTELVMVISYGDKASEEMFNKYFTSPMHSCAIVKGAASIDFFKGIASLPIPEVKARYYTLDKTVGSSVTVKASEDQADSFMVGSQNFSKNEEKSTSESNVSEPTSNSESFGTSEQEDSAVLNVSEPVSNLGVSGDTTDIWGSNQDENTSPVWDAPVTDLSSGSTLEDFSEEDEDDLLSVGSFGYAHSDTGLFDEEEEEIEEIQESKESTPEPSPEPTEETKLTFGQEHIQTSSQEPMTGIVSEPVQETDYRSESSHIKEGVEEGSLHKSNPEFNPVIYPYSKNKINLVVSTSGTVSAQQIIDDATRITDIGLNTVILDMDYVSNSVLSFINVEEFYRTSKRFFDVYEEDGVYLMSAGYGCIPSIEDILSVIDFCKRTYDVVIVSCPVSSFKYLDSGTLDGSNIVVVSGNDPCQIVETSLALTDRKNVSLELERKIMKSHNTILIGGKTELVDEAVGNMFFANGCWV